MEFLFRAPHNKRTPSPLPTSYIPPPSLSTLTYFSRRSLPDGISRMVPSPRPNTFPMAMNNGGEALRRELEKDQIRREIIAGGIARRRELEEEVRREMALEREWGHGFSFDERMSMRLNPFDNNNNNNNNVYGEPPQLMPAAEFKPSPETNNKDKLIKLAKPDRNLYDAKRKAVAPPDVDGSEHLPFGLKKKPKEEWSCALCQVSATGERGFTEHLHGRKHRAKETALRNQKIGKSTNTSLSFEKSEKYVKSNEAIVSTTSGLDAKADGPSFQLGITRGDIIQTMPVESKNEEQLVQENQNIKGLKNENGTTTGQDAGGINALKKGKKMKFWCEICQVGTGSQTVMESHKKGRKHLARMKKFSKNYGSAPPTSSVSLEAPGLIKDTDAVNKETDQKVTYVVSKETMIRMINTFADSDEVSLVAESDEDRAGGGL